MSKICLLFNLAISGIRWEGGLFKRYSHPILTSGKVRFIPWVCHEIKLRQKRRNRLKLNTLLQASFGALTTSSFSPTSTIFLVTSHSNTDISIIIYIITSELIFYCILEKKVCLRMVSGKLNFCIVSQLKLLIVDRYLDKLIEGVNRMVTSSESTS